MSVVICDDDVSRIQLWIADIQAIVGDRGTVTGLTGTDLVSAVEALFERREASPADDAARIIDSADILIVDSDLTPDAETLKQFSTDDQQVLEDGLSGRVGETVAYNARVRSGAKYIVVVNQGYSDRTFDLTMRRFASSVADLYVSAADIVDPNLWDATAADGHYQPWAWPQLASTPEKYVRARALTANLDNRVSESIGLDLSGLFAEQLDVFGDVEPNEATFRDLAESQLGLRPKDQATSDDSKARVAASVLLRWLDRYVVPPQNELADLAHLVLRFPRMFEAFDSVDSLQQVFETSKGPDAARSPLSELHGRSLYSVEIIREMSRSTGTSGTSQVDAVFAEDTSRFVSYDDGVEILTALPGSNARRFIEEVDDIRYLPRVRRL